MKKVFGMLIVLYVCFSSTVFAGGSSENSKKTVQQAALGPLSTASSKSQEYILREKELSDNLEKALDEKNIFEVVSAWDLLASHSATASVLPNPTSEKLSNYQNRINGLLDTIAIQIVKNPKPTIAGRTFSSDFVVQIFMKDESSVITPLADIPLTVICPVKNSDGEKSFFSETITSSFDGTVTFTAPIPSSSLSDVLIFHSNFSGSDQWMNENLENRKEKGQFLVKIPYKVETAKKAIPTTISILDFDKNGRPVMYNNATATALLMPMVQKGFTRIGMADFQQQLGSGDEAALLRAAKNQFGTAVDRFIFGTTKISSLSKGDDGLWACTLATEVSVWIFSENRKIFSVHFTHTEKGTSEAAALDAARKKNAAEKLLAELLYNL